MADELRVILAGYNIDAELIEQVKGMITRCKELAHSTDLSEEDKQKLALSLVGLIGKIDTAQFTPETISAAYARISRRPDEIPELRRQAREDVVRARSSNEQIIYGLGHKSIGNHVVFNFDILGVSRLAVEFLEARRLGCGYTEKSQRYITLDGDYVMPSEFSAEDREKFSALVEIQNRFYKDRLERIIEYHYDCHGIPAGKKDRNIDNLGKEDARYVLSLATQAQVGTSFNATALEQAIRTMKYSELAETRELAAALFRRAKDIAPSLIACSDVGIFQSIFPGKELHDENFRDAPAAQKKAVRELLEGFPRESGTPQLHFRTKGAVMLINCNDIDTNIIAALLHSRGHHDVTGCYYIASEMNAERRRQFAEEILEHVTEFDNPSREFEFATSLKFEVILSSSAYAQLKRHRIMTLLSQDYNPALGVTIPDSIKNTGLDAELREICDRSTGLYNEFRPKYGKAAEYCLTNAHRRRVLVGVNPRELHALVRQRCDEHAQWDIRKISNDMLYLAKIAAPLAHLVTCGKDEFAALREEVYSSED
jgi:thymidylate synthase ThyX